MKKVFLLSAILFLLCFMYSCDTSDNPASNEIKLGKITDHELEGLKLYVVYSDKRWPYYVGVLNKDVVSVGNTSKSRTTVVMVNKSIVGKNDSTTQRVIVAESIISENDSIIVVKIKKEKE